MNTRSTTIDQAHKLPITSGPSSVLDCTLGRQVQISEEVYRETFDRLVEAIDSRDYFSGSVAFEVGDIKCRMTVAVIVYRDKVSCPDGESDEISKLVPVWWEFHTNLLYDEIPNNFRFDELKKYI